MSCKMVIHLDKLSWHAEPAKQMCSFDRPLGRVTAKTISATALRPLLRTVRLPHSVQALDKFVVLPTTEDEASPHAPLPLCQGIHQDVAGGGWGWLVVAQGACETLWGESTRFAPVFVFLGAYLHSPVKVEIPRGICEPRL